MKILVVDDDDVFLDKMRKNLTLDNHIIKTASSGEKALLVLENDHFNLILSDLKMPGLSGIDFLKKIREKGIDTILVMITGYGTIQSAVEAMKEGAYDYLLKPFEMKNLRKKIKQVELDINLRKRLPISKELKKSLGGDLEQLDIEEYQGPFLIISDINPDAMIQKLNITEFVSILLNYHEHNATMSSIYLNSLKTKIKKFFEENEKGTIIFKGIEQLLKIYEWEDLKRFISYLLSEVITLDFDLILLISKDSDYLDQTQEKILNNTLSLFINPIFNKIINLLSHPLRKNIITLLKTEKQLNFNKIAKKLEVNRSSVLAFHINKLVKEVILKKEENLYSLSEIGHFYADIISHLEKLGFSYPESQIKLYQAP
ncbi:MAG: response regulator [Candidatus Helarchaeota archaeon]